MALGTKMITLDNILSGLKYPIARYLAEIRSCFVSARKLGIWAPDDRLLDLHTDTATDIVRDYLRHVGRMLSEARTDERSLGTSLHQTAKASETPQIG